MNRLLIISYLLISWGTSYAQVPDLLRIQGTVIDAETKEAIEFASVSLQNEPLGTITNSDGRFVFQISKDHLNDTIIISHVGFTSFEALANDLNNQLIELQWNPVQLKEITIETAQLDGTSIVKEAFDRVRSNFAQEPYCLRGFFRQTSIENNKCVLLVEAALDIYDSKVKLQRNFDLKEKVVVKQVRSSNNYFKHQNHNFFDGANLLKLLLNWNYTRYENPYVLTREDFAIDSLMYHQERLIYVISSTFSDEKLTNRFTMHIDAETMAFVKIKNENQAKGEALLGVTPLLSNRSKLFGMKYSVQEYSFKTFKGKSYLANCTSSNTAAIIDKKSGAVERTVTDENLLVIAEIQGPLTIPKANFMDPNLNIKDQPFAYDAAFWKDYQQVKLTPLTKQQVRDLELEQSLTDQFTQNAKRL